MTPDEMKAIVIAFPLSEESTSYGQPSFKVNGKFFTRLREEDASLVLTGVSFNEREMLMEADPATFHTNPALQGLSQRARPDRDPRPGRAEELPRPSLAQDCAEEAGQGARCCEERLPQLQRPGRVAAHPLGAHAVL